MGLLDLLVERLQGALQRPQAARSWRCRCGAPIFFANSRCLACGAELGFVPETLSLQALPGPGAVHGSPPLQRCAHHATIGCNWMLPVREASSQGGLCRACRLTRTVPDCPSKTTAAPGRRSRRPSGGW